MAEQLSWSQCVIWHSGAYECEHGRGKCVVQELFQSCWECTHVQVTANYRGSYSMYLYFRHNSPHPSRTPGEWCPVTLPLSPPRCMLWCSVTTLPSHPRQPLERRQTPCHWTYLVKGHTPLKRGGQGQSQQRVQGYQKLLKHELECVKLCNNIWRQWVMEKHHNVTPSGHIHNMLTTYITSFR